MLTMSHDFPGVARQLDALRDDVATKAQARILNRAGEQGKTASVREIARRYAVSASFARDRIRLSRATFKGGRFFMTVVIQAGDGKHRAANVIHFAAKENKVGVSVKVRRDGPRRTIPGAFIGNKGRTVFIRTGSKRLPIKSVQTIDIPQMFNARKVKDTVLRVIRERLPAIAEREIAFYVARFNASNTRGPFTRGA